jgi:N,N'-diacetyllegionaminate synthase
MLKNFSKTQCYIVAEIGGNFTDFEQAKKLVDNAIFCGVDAVKIQTYRAETVASKKAFFDMENTGIVSQFDLFRKYELDVTIHQKLLDYIKDKSIDWFSTPSHATDVDFLEKLLVPAYKIGSDDAVNIPLLKHIARTGKPIFLATGMCTMEEVWHSVAAIFEEGNDRLTLLHAVTSYPTHAKDVNLLAMKSMINEFPLLDVGYSDHTIGTNACICAAAMGARVVEKHFTYDKHAEGPDHMLSADPREMKEIVDKIREFEMMRGNGIKRPANSEKLTRINNRKSLVVVRSLRKGEKIAREHLDIKRPGTGIPPKYLDEVIGRCVTKDLNVDDVLCWDDC